MRLVAAAGCIAVTIVATGTFFFLRSRGIMTAQLKEKLRSTAAVAAIQFNGAELMTIHGRASTSSTVYQESVDKLRRIRDNVPGLRFAYILRKTDKENILEFVADADALLPENELDRNGNGVIEDDEQPSIAGDLYDASGVRALQDEAFLHPTVDEQVTTDQWGQAISGYAPIWDAKGKSVAVIGLDMDAKDYAELSQSIFSPVAYLLLVMAGILLSSYIVLYAWQKRLESLEEMDTERAAFMNLALHQLGAPLAAVRWWMDILGEEGKGTDPEAISDIKQAIDRMDSILEVLSKATSIARGQLVYTPVPTSLRSLIQAEANQAEVLLKRRKQILQCSLPENDDLQLSIDPKLIAAVLRELVDNASAYSPEGSAIQLKAERHRDGSVDVSVADHGFGIPQSDQARVFEKFFRGSNAHRFKPVGNGLGLYIALALAHRNKGKITFQSREGEGTTFFLRLPSSTTSFRA